MASIRGKLQQVVVAAALPAMLLSGFIVWTSYREQGRTLEVHLLETTRALAAAVDLDLGEARALMAGLATSPHLTNGDVAAFYAQAAAALPDPYRWITLIDGSNGRLLLNTKMQFGASLPRFDNENSWTNDVKTTRRPVVKDVVRSVTTQTWAVTMHYPVVRDDRVVYVLGLATDTKLLQQRLDAQGLPPEWVVSVLDRGGAHLARSRDSDRFMGHPGSATLMALWSQSREGVGTTTSLEGIPLLTAFTRSPEWGWTVAVGVPEGEIAATLYRSLLWVIAGSAAVVLLALFLVVVLTRRIARPIHALADSAIGLGEGRPVELVPSGLKEIDAVGTALRETATRLRAREAALNELNQTLEQQVEERTQALAQSQKMEALGQLTGGVAHDFNNLLTVITGGINMLQRRLKAIDADVGRYLDAMKRAADRAANLTQGLLAFARRQPLEPKPIDANKLVTGMTELLRRTLGEKIEIETVLAGGLWRCSADVNRLESAIVNLAVNARDAMPEGGKLTIETANALLDEAYASNEDVKPGRYVMIAVSDTGIGMSKEHIAKAFEPFFTTKQIGEGTGLGLSQVQGFIKQSGGHIKIYSELREGTTVKLYMPWLDHGGAADALTEARAQMIVTGKEAILVVEDDEDVRAFAAEILDELGYLVLLAADARSALDVLEREKDVDLLFTDVGLPKGMNGRQLAEEALRRRPGLKVLFTTGYARNAIVHHGRLDPGIELILKPFTDIDLAEKVRHVLDGGGNDEP